MLRQVQQRHPLLRVRIPTDAIGQPKFVETDDEIPLRLVARTDDRHWQAELEVELACLLDWQVAPLLRVVLLQSGAESELMIICHHAIADGLSVSDRTFLPHYRSNQRFLASHHPQKLLLSPQAIYHACLVVLSAKLTQQLIQRSRAKHATGHGAISAAFLLALTQQDIKPSDVLQCLHPVNVRSHLSLPMSDGVGLYICLCMTSHSLRADTAFWDVARSVKSQLSLDIAQQLVEESQLRQSAMANLTDATAFAEAARSQYPCQLNVTNLGRIDLAQQYGNIRIEALHAPAVMPSVVGRNVGVATLGDRLALTILSTPLISDKSS